MDNLFLKDKFNPMINKKFFFDHARATLFNGKFSQRQVDGINAILSEWETKYANKDDRWLAYMLATVHHETDRKMQPIEEYGRGRKKDYGKKLKMGLGPGKRVPYSTPEALYYGRGFVQLTWYENYEKASKKLHIDCLEHPELVLELKNAAAILFKGMMEGWFTTKKLADYFSSEKEDWLNARRIINGKDKADLIKDYALRYYACISYV